MTEAGKKIYFVSDCHLGIPDYTQSLEREKKLVRWLDWIQSDAEELYILGDLFDFWFEYKTVVPKGYIRLFGKLAELVDKGIKITLFTGNHDMWMFGYLQEELGIEIIRHPVEKQINGMSLYIGHGDGLGKGDYGYKFIKKVFANKVCQWLFARLHPNFAIGLGLFFSRRSRLSRGDKDYTTRGDEYERLLNFTKAISENTNLDAVILGHRHLPFDKKVNDKTRYINLGDWLVHFTYLEISGKEITLKTFEE